MHPRVNRYVQTNVLMAQAGVNSWIGVVELYVLQQDERLHPLHHEAQPPSSLEGVLTRVEGSRAVLQED